MGKMRSREIRSGGMPSSTQSVNIERAAHNVLRAKIELKRLGRNPRDMSFGHQQNIDKHIHNGTANNPYWHALIDYRNGNKHLLHKLLSMQEAFRKNLFLKGSGKAWAKFEPGGVIPK